MKNFTTLISIFLSIFFMQSLSAQCFSDQSFDTPGEHTYIIPGLASESFLIEIETRGADGGDFLWNGNPQTDGGQGATMGASFVVNGGDELLIIVGQSGQDALGSPGGGGGGGGTAVIINNADVLIAAGAGGGGGQLQVGFGGGASTNSSAIGGTGPGTSGGGGFNQAGMNGLGGTGGGAGTLNGQGLGGTQGVVAGPGGNGFGGGAGGSGTVGGGGGGYQGGNGATGMGGQYGGFGGNSFVTTSYGSSVLTTIAGTNGGGNNIDGDVTITCTPTGDVEIGVDLEMDPSCFGASDGSIEVVGLGGTAPYTYTLNGGASQSSGLFEGLAAGLYTLMVLDDVGNSASTNVTLDNPTEVGYNVVLITDVSCFGGSDGSVEIEGFGGNASSGFYSYSIDGGPFQSSGLFTGLEAGSHLVVVEDDNGCSLDGDVTVGDQDEINVIITNQSDASCADATNGSVTFSSSGGQGGYSYSLDGTNFQTPASFDNLAVGDYTVTVMDNGNCTTTLDFSIGIADPYTFLILDTTDTDCDGTAGSVNMLATGGIGGFTYSIDGSTFQMSGSFAGLDAGAYTATASDGAGCTQELQFDIAMSSSLNLNAAPNGPTCAGGMNGFIELTLDPAGAPYTIEWTGEGVVVDAEDQSNLGAGTYSVTVSDNNDCSVTEEFVLVPGTTVEMSVTDMQNPTCNGGANGEVVVSASGGEEPYTYSFDGQMNNSGEFDGLEAGMYLIDVADNNGCTAQIMATINDPAVTITLMVTNQTEAGCDGDTSGTATLAAENGVGTIFYTLNGMTNTTGEFTGLASGPYTASATDDNGCAAEVNVTIMENTTLSGNVLATTDVSCEGGSDGSVTVEGIAGSGTFTYSIDNMPAQASGEFTGLTAGDHSIIIRDTEGCSSALTVTISEPSAVTLSIDTVIDATCFGEDDGSVTFSVEGGTAPYNLISDGNELEIPNSSIQTIGEIFPGTYAVMVTDANGCTLESSVTIGQPTEVMLVVDVLTDVTCKGAQDGMYSYQIEGGTGPYMVTNGADQFAVSTDDVISEDNLAPRAYELEIIDSRGCIANHTLTISEPDTLEFIINEQIPASCFDESDAYISFMIIGGTAPYDIIDEDGDILEVENSDAVESNEAEAGVFPITIMDANGCTIETTVTVTQPDLLELANLTIVDSDETGNGSITIEAMGGTGDYTYAIDGDNFQSDPTFSGLAEDTYDITVLDANGCSFTVSATIVSTDVNDISNDILTLSVGPNPANQLIYINMDMKKMVEMKVQVLDIQGKSVMEINPTVTLGNQTIRLDIGSLDSGLYLIDISTNKGHFTKRVIIQ